MNNFNKLTKKKKKTAKIKGKKKLRNPVQRTHSFQRLESQLKKELHKNSVTVVPKQEQRPIIRLQQLRPIVYLKAIHLRVVSPAAVKLWTTRIAGTAFPAGNSSLLTGVIDPHVSSLHPEDSVLSPVSGNMYTTDSLWNSNVKGSLLRGHWKKVELAVKVMAREISSHEIQNARTLDYKTLEPHEKGLFCNTIFPKTVKGRGVDYQRRTQLGFIKLVAPVAHIWYLKARPNQLHMLLNLKPKFIKWAAYYQAVGARQQEIPQLRAVTQPMRTLFQNRNKNRHYCHNKTFWLNHTVSFTALPNTLFNTFISNWGLTSFLGLEQPRKNHPKSWNLLSRLIFENTENDSEIKNLPLIWKKWAWEEQATEETFGTILTQDAAFWSQPWVSFLSSHTFWRKQNKNFVKKTWQQQVLVEMNHKLNKFLSIAQDNPKYCFRKILQGFLYQNQVLNTFQSVLKIDNTKATVILISCTRKFEPLSQTEVHSNFSPALKAFFNHVWAIGRKKTYPYDLEKKFVIPLIGYKSDWVPKMDHFTQNPYKKEMIFSTYKQGVNDGLFFLYNQFETEEEYIQYTRLLIYSQLIKWASKVCDSNVPKVFFTETLEKRKKRLPTGFRWLSVPTEELELFKPDLTFGDLMQERLDKYNKEKEENKNLKTFNPVSLYTRLLEIDREGQVKKIFLLPFLDHFTRIKTGYQLGKKWELIFERIRGSAAFHTENQKKPNPLGTSKFRTFLQQFFQLSCKKNGLLFLIKNSKPILMSYILESHEFTVLKKSGSDTLSQHGYEKQKCVYHFLTHLLLAGNGVIKSKTKKRVLAFVTQQYRKLRLIEKPIFSASDAFFYGFTAHPFCYHLLNQTFHRRKSLILLNPFSLKEKPFLVRYLQTFRGPCYPNISNFILGYYRFQKLRNSNKNLNQHNRKKNRKKFKSNRRLLSWGKPRGWRRVSKPKPKVHHEYNKYPFGKFEPPADEGRQRVDLQTRIDWLRFYFSHRTDLRRNTLGGMVPTRFIFRKSFRIIEEEWSNFEKFIKCETVQEKDLCLPSYIDRILFIGQLFDQDLKENRPMYNMGGDILRHSLRRYATTSQDLTFSLPEIEKNKRRRAVQEPCILSYDHEPFFHERNVSLGPVRSGTPIYYQIKSEPAGILLRWLIDEIEFADKKIYYFEKKLHSFFGLRRSFARWNITKWEIPLEKRFKEHQEDWPDPYTVVPFFSRTFANTSKRFYQRKMYSSYVALKRRRYKRIRYLKAITPFFRHSFMSPEWLMIQNLPVLPPDLRPILILGNQIIVSDITQQYQQIIRRVDRGLVQYSSKFFYRTGSMGQEPNTYDFYCGRLLQESVDGLMENGKGEGKIAVSPSTQQPLKSLSDMLKGKKGRFRQNLLGKRVDYSGRSVIVVGPKLGIYECGLPKQMALELFKPFVIREMLIHGYAHQPYIAKRMINEKRPFVWELLRKVMSNRPVLLNRAPTLHRLGMQAFRPKLVSGRAILLHPLVCSAYNADFDGDQMAVHVPVTELACSEAWNLMWSRNNILSPATGEPTLLPSQDMILGCYYLTTFDKIHRAYQLKQEKILGKQKIYGPFQSIDQVLRLVQMQILDYHSVVWLKWPYGFEFEQKKQRCIEMQIDRSGHIIKIYKDYKVYDNLQSSHPIYFIKTTPGRALFNQSIWNSLK